MGANMQRQAVPLIDPHAPLIGTGIEYKAAHDAGVRLFHNILVLLSTLMVTEIRVRREDGSLDEVFIDEVPSFKRR